MKILKINFVDFYREFESEENFIPLKFRMIFLCHTKSNFPSHRAKLSSHRAKIPNVFSFLAIPMILCRSVTGREMVTALQASLRHVVH